MFFFEINQHILGIDSLDTPYHWIAADVNNDRQVSVADLISLRKIILGKIDEFPNNTSWRFVPLLYNFQNPENPLQEEFPEEVVTSGINQAIRSLEFCAIKIGDVAGPYY